MPVRAVEVQMQRLSRSIVLLAGIVAGGGALVTGLALYTEYRLDEMAGRHNVEMTAVLLQGQTRLALTRLDTTIDSAAAWLRVGDPTETELRAFLSRQARAEPLAVGISIVGPDGRTVMSSRGQDGLSGLDVSDRDYFRAHVRSGALPEGLFTAKESSLYVGAPIRSRVDNQWIIPVSRALYNPDGSLRAVVMIVLEPRRLSRLLEAGGTDPGRRSTMARTDGVILTTLPFDEEAVGKDVSASLFFAERLRRADEGVYRERSADGADNEVAFRVAKPWPVVLSFALDRRHVLGPFRRALFTDLTLMAVVLAFVVTAARYQVRLSGRVARQARALAHEISRRQATQEKYRELFESARDGIVFAGLDGRIEDANPAFCEMLGYSLAELRRMKYADFTLPRWREREERILREQVMVRGYSDEYEKEYVRKDGAVLPVSIRAWLERDAEGRPLRAFAHVRDITARRRAEESLRRNEEERRELEDRMRHMQKLESLGVLAGGIAHGFNNLLVAILGNADLALLHLAEGSRARRHVEEVKSASLRASELTNQMLAYSGKGRFIVGPVNLNDLIGDMAALLGVTVSKKVVMRREFYPDLPSIRADATQIRQVVMNLIVNASEAVGENPGVIAIRTGVIEADREYLAGTYLDEGRPEGRYVFLEVSDTGCGITEEDMPRLFDPFFTTKFTGRGLGLAAVLGIVRGHGGAIRVQSRPGQGATFTVLFPVDATALPTGPHVSASDDVESWRGQGTALVIDDEESVRAVARMMLSLHGLNVMDAGDGQAGIERFRESADEIAVVILDLTMPNMSGAETLRELRRIPPDVKVVVTSGYTETEAASRLDGQAPAAFVQKPFEMRKFVGAVRKAMDGL